MVQVPDIIDNKIMSRVRGDLQPSPALLYGKAALAIGLGGFISLYICGQFGFGMTFFATTVNHSLHQGYGAILCALACGSIFAVVPAVILRLISSPMQFRVMLRKRWEAAAIWITAFGGMLAWHGKMGNEFLYFGIWLVTAFATYRLAGELIDLIDRASSMFGTESTQDA